MQLLYFTFLSPENVNDVAEHILNLINESPLLDEEETKIIVSKVSDISVWWDKYEPNPDYITNNQCCFGKAKPFSIWSAWSKQWVNTSTLVK